MTDGHEQPTEIDTEIEPLPPQELVPEKLEPTKRDVFWDFQVFNGVRVTLERKLAEHIARQTAEGETIHDYLKRVTDYNEEGDEE